MVPLALLRLGALLLGGLLAANGWAEPRYRLGVERDYGPFVYADAQGQPQGLSVELLQRLAPLGGFRVDPQPPRSLPELLTQARQGELELITSLRPTPERSDYLSYSAPYAQVPAILVARRGTGQRLSLRALAGQAVGVGEGYAAETPMRKRYPAVRWLAQPDDATALRRLAAGELAAVVLDSASFLYTVQRLNLQDLQAQGPVGFEYALSFAYPRERGDVGERLATALRALPAAELRVLHQRWIDAAAYRFEDPRYSLLTQLAVLCASGAVVLLAWSLLHRPPAESEERAHAG